MVRRLIATVVAIIVIGGCSASSPTPGPSDSTTVPPSPGGTPGAADPSAAPPETVNLTVATEDAAAVVGSIGPGGGQLSTSAADGTTYTLDIPPGALLFTEDISMTPVVEADGLPDDIAPEHFVGVKLGPDGLDLLPPATLTVKAASPLPVAGVATMGFRGDGSDAGLELFDQTGSELTIQVDHFSGYLSFWPVSEEWWERRDRIERNTFIEQQRSDLITALDIEKQRQKFRGNDELTGLPLHELVSSLSSKWDKKVFGPLLRLAPTNCRYADAALRAYVVWEQVLRQVGVSLSPEEYKQATAEQRALSDEMRREPSDELRTLKRDLCFEEEFQRCRHTGDFEHLVHVVMGHFRQLEIFGGASSEDMELAQLYLERCGIWDLTIESVETISVAHPLGPVTQTFHQKRTYPIRWRPNDSLYGVIGTRAAGNGALEIIAATGSAPGCPEVLYKYDGTDPVDTASIERLMFDQRPNSVITYRDPNLLEPVQLEGPSDEPIPRKVELGLSFGTQDWAWVWETCKTFMGITAFGWNGNYLLTALGHDSFLNTRGIRQIAVNPATSDGWLFDTDPFKATLTKTRAFPEPFLDSVLPASVSVELIITLEHTPAP